MKSLKKPSYFFFAFILILTGTLVKAQDSLDHSDLVMEMKLPQTNITNDIEQQLLHSLPNAVWKPIGMAEFSDKNEIDAETAWKQHVENSEFIQEEALMNELVSQGGVSDNRSQQSARWIAVDLQSGVEYSVEIPHELGRNLHAYLEQTGQTQGFEGEFDTQTEQEFSGDSEIEPSGWSKGEDTRTRRYNNTTYPYRTMGEIGESCSGTLVGSRHILTAAHCLWNVKTKKWNKGKFIPGREGRCDSAKCKPYGEYSARWLFTPAEFRKDINWTYDYGIMVTWGRPGNLTGWMGYVATSQSTLNSYCDKVPFGSGYLGGSCYNRGYPVCGLEGSPVEYESCRLSWAYQDVNPCEVGSFILTASAGDGWKSNFTTNCDMSIGHSGSAVWTDRWGGSGKVIFGVASTQACSTCSSGTSYPNRIRRVTPDVLNAISYFKTVKYP